MHKTKATTSVSPTAGGPRKRSHTVGTSFSAQFKQLSLGEIQLASRKDQTSSSVQSQTSVVSSTVTISKMAECFRQPVADLPAETVESKFSSRNQWAISFFTSQSDGWTCNVLVNGRVCGQHYNKTTNKTNLVDHLEKKHLGHIGPIPAHLERPINGAQQVSLISLLPTAGSPLDKVVLAFAMNALPYSLASDAHFRDAFSQGLHGFNSRSLPQATADMASRIRQHLKQSLSNTVRSLVMDGGKDIAQNKLIAIGIGDGKTVALWDLVDTQLCVLDGNYYFDLLSKIISELEELGCFISSINVDNEGSPNAGITKLIESKYPHIVHLRCAAHTIELLMAGLLESHTMIQNQVKCCVDLINTIKNTKDLMREFVSLQTALTNHTLSLLLPNNTRKWSGTYLMVRRILRLKLPLQALIDKMELSPLNWQVLADIEDMLAQFYIREQILQRDCSSSIHSAFFWRSLVDLIESMLHVLSEASKQKLQKKIEKHNKKMLSSDIFYLSLALWPNPKLSTQERKLALEELEKFINNQFLKYLQFRVALRLPPEYNLSTKGDFLLHAKAELNQHLSAPSPSMQGARNFFVDKTSNLQFKEERLHLVSLYWESLAAEIPALFVVISVLLKTQATEAAAERFFSSESLIHNDLRNRLTTDKVLDIMTIRWNAKFSTLKKEEEDCVEVF